MGWPDAYGARIRELVQHAASAQRYSVCDARAKACGARQRNFGKAQGSLRSGQVQQARPLEVKTDAQLGAHQRGVAKPAARACGVARKNGDGRLEKRTTLLTNTDSANGDEAWKSILDWLCLPPRTLINSQW